MRFLEQLLTYTGFINWKALTLLIKNRPAFRAFLRKIRIFYWEEHLASVPEKNFYNLFPEAINSQAVVKIIAEPATGGTTTDDLFFLSLMVKTLKPKIIFEIGTFDGVSAVHFALNSSDPKTLIYTLDLPPTNEIKFSELEWDFLKERRPGYFIERYQTTAVRQLFGNSMNFDFSPYYGQVDLMFIDGNHNAEYVRHDTAEALKMVRPGGVIVWHDFYGMPGEDVSDVIVQFARKYPIFRIKNTCLAVLKII